MATENEAAAIRDRLLKALGARREGIDKLDRYYRGDHDLPSITAKARDEFSRLMRDARMNWCELIVDAVAERLDVSGFRFGDSIGQDDVAWRLWQGNQLDAYSELVHTDALTCARAFVLVWPDDSSPVGVRATGETAAEAIVSYVSGSQTQRDAALKSWIDDATGLGFCTLYLAEEVWKWQTTRRVLSASGVGRSWERRDVDGEDWPLENPLAPMVPMVEFRPRPHLRGEPQSEIGGAVLNVQDRVNKTILDRLMTQEFAAFRQRWATGLAIPINPDTGQPVAPFQAAVDRVWVTENPEARFGEFGQTDLSGYLGAVESDVVHLAAITRTPPHYLLGKMANVSGDALKAAETGLVAKVRRRMKFLGESWEEVMRLMLWAIDERERATDISSEVIWRDPESRSEGETVDALVKMSGLGVPREVLWQRWGASPQEVSRWKAMAAAEAFSPVALAARAALGVGPAQPPAALPPGSPPPA